MWFFMLYSAQRLRCSAVHHSGPQVFWRSVCRTSGMNHSLQILQRLFLALAFGIVQSPSNGMEIRYLDRRPGGRINGGTSGESVFERIFRAVHQVGQVRFPAESGSEFGRSQQDSKNGGLAARKARKASGPTGPIGVRNSQPSPRQKPKSTS